MIETLVVGGIAVGLVVGGLWAWLSSIEMSPDDMLVEHHKRYGRYFPEGQGGEWFCRGMRYMNEHGCYELTPDHLEHLRDERT